MLPSPADLSAIALAKAEGKCSVAESGGERDLSAVASVAKEEGDLCAEALAKEYEGKAEL